MKLRYFSTFSGIGGFELGIKCAAKRLGIDVECIGHSEIDKYAESVYQRHFKGSTNYGDITKIEAKDLPDFEILVGGFPCQSYSLAGKKQGLKDERGQLFYDFVRIIEAKKPKVIVLENVKALLGNDGGRSFSTILSEMAKLGYYVEWQVLNSSHYGVPQARERVVIIGLLGDKPSEQILPLEPFGKTRLNEARFISYNVIRDAVKLKDTANTIIANYKGLGNYGQPAVLTGDGRIRKLTPLECERLMGLPDNWTAFGVDGKRISDTQRYHQCGNAVCIGVIMAVFDRIFSIKGLLKT